LLRLLFDKEYALSTQLTEFKLITPIKLKNEQPMVVSLSEEAFDFLNNEGICSKSDSAKPKEWRSKNKKNITKPTNSSNRSSQCGAISPVEVA
jgi:hypothetical protein